MGWAGKYDKGITEYKFWQESNHAIHFSPHFSDVFKQKFDYIHDNPVRADIVENAEEYVYSSARDYAGKRGLVKLTMAY